MARTCLFGIGHYTAADAGLLFIVGVSSTYASIAPYIGTYNFYIYDFTRPWLLY